MAKRDGYWSGWTDYRYGNRKKVTLAQPLGEKRVSKTKDRPVMVSSIMASLKDWRLSQFEHEAATRHAVRSHFICRGVSWTPSDIEADLLIQEAIRNLGYERPSLAEGQPQYTAPTGQCLRCGNLVDDEDQAKGYRFCSVVCAQSSKVASIEDVTYREDWIRHRAQYEFAMRNSAERKCKVCGKGFKSYRAEATTCSSRCARHSKGDILQPRKCGWCENEFQPQDRQQHYCCKSCSKNDNVRKFRATQPEIVCQGCRAVFRPGRKGAVSCSQACASKAFRMRRAVARRPANIIPFVPMHMLTAEVFDGLFRRAA